MCNTSYTNDDIKQFDLCIKMIGTAQYYFSTIASMLLQDDLINSHHENSIRKNTTRGNVILSMKRSSSFTRCSRSVLP